ncbi:MAG TPA: hypothetical protein VMV18_01860 [bacterium]|nr:hypothetical protein [bacterium]
MNLSSVIRRSVDLSLHRRSLWLFGFFVAGGGGGAALNAQTGTAGGHGGGGPIPLWVFALIAVGVVLALASLVMHLASEGALIDGVRRANAGEPTPVREEMRAGLHSATRILGIKAAAFAAMLAAALVVASPVALSLLRNGTPWLGLALTVPLAILFVPFFLSMRALQLIAMREAVLSGLGVRDALAKAFEFLHGRIADVLWLLVAEGVGTFAGNLAAGVVAVVLLLPAALVWWLAGVVPAAILAGILLVPVALVWAAALGTWRSSLWTLALLDERSA